LVGHRVKRLLVVRKVAKKENSGPIIGIREREKDYLAIVWGDRPIKWMHWGSVKDFRGYSQKEMNKTKNDRGVEHLIKATKFFSCCGQRIALGV